MARNKNSNDTKNEIIEVATNLFIQNGYESTTIEDIFKNWGGSKGSLYYYFKSKEEIIDAVVDVLVSQEEKRIKEVLSKADLPALDMLQLLLVTCLNKPKQLDGMEGYIYQSKNVTLLYRIVKLYIEKSIPIIEPIILRGIEEGIFHTEYPAEVIEFALLIEEFIFKYSMFEYDEQRYLRKIAAFQKTLELTLGLKTGSLNQLSSFCEQTNKKQRDGLL